jgi:hypothetical protein
MEGTLAMFEFPVTPGLNRRCIRGNGTERARTTVVCSGEPTAWRDGR